MSPTRLQKLLTFDWVLITVFFATFFLLAPLHWAQSTARRTGDSSNLIYLANCAERYASEHDGQLPAARDIWNYAALLANSQGANDSRAWQSRADPATDPELWQSPITVLIPGSSENTRTINPAFLQIKPCIAVALGDLKSTMPATTPLAWTRGLQPEGTWAQHSPYGSAGGYIVFLDGHSAFFKNLKSDCRQLTRFDGQGKTANILEALPPGTRISEYHPTPAEASTWWWHHLWQRYSGPDYYGFPIFWTGFLTCIAARLHRKNRQVAQVFTTLGIIIGLKLLLMTLSD